ncbi:calmodulin-2/4-like isoform X3 [Haliotis rubra]|uniref:calmodulin-2/4-like isoform X3 n=1 Tax=Haliotis rubra TaxID=36100 RepID=UPI001EE57043|nr:calmodulin-2/4-like isoform X3 [Haliotis rubra]
MSSITVVSEPAPRHTFLAGRRSLTPVADASFRLPWLRVGLSSSEMFHGVDTDNNDKITLDEFLATMPGISTVERKCANLRQVFIAADINEDGVLSCQELREAVRSVGSALQPSDIDTLLARLDKDGEGKLSYEQFLEHFSKQKKV